MMWYDNCTGKFEFGKDPRHTVPVRPDQVTVSREILRNVYLGYPLTPSEYEQIREALGQ